MQRSQDFHKGGALIIVFSDHSLAVYGQEGRGWVHGGDVPLSTQVFMGIQHSKSAKFNIIMQYS